MSSFITIPKTNDNEFVSSEY